MWHMSMPLAHIQSTINVTLLLCLENLIISTYLVAIINNIIIIIIIIIIMPCQLRLCLPVATMTSSGNHK